MKLTRTVKTIIGGAGGALALVIGGQVFALLGST